MSSLRRNASTSSSRHPTQSKRSQAYRGMETVPEYEPLPNPPRSQQVPDHRSTRLSGAEGQKLMVRSSHKQSTRASRHDDDDDEDVRGLSRKEVSFAEGGVLAHKHRSEGGGGGSGRGESTSTSKSSRTQVPYNDEPTRRGGDRWRSTTAVTGESSRRKTNNREDEEKTITRGGDRTVTRQDKERTITRSTRGGGAQDYGYTEERTITRDDNDARALVPYGKERTMTRSKRGPGAAGDYDDYTEDRTITRNDTRMVGPRLQTIRDDERAAKTRTKPTSCSSSSLAPSRSSSTIELKRRVEQLEDEKTRRLEKQVEKLGDQVAQLQMDKGKQQAPVAVYAPVVYAPGYPCDCEYCLYGRGGYSCRSRY
ncbi:MAG: hypothetical protein Q9177_000703 [Variospora cf. flavescens]